MKRAKRLILFLLIVLTFIGSCVQAESQVINKINSAGNSDGYQQAAGDLGNVLKNFGDASSEQMNFYAKKFPNIKEGYEKLAQNAKIISSVGKMIGQAAQAAPYIGELSTAAGYADAGNVRGAMMKATNGVMRTYTVSTAGATAAGVTGLAIDIWAAGELAAIGGSVGGPALMVPAFIVGVVAAYTTGKVWDMTAGAAVDAAIQKDLDFDAQEAYASPVKEPIRSDTVPLGNSGQKKEYWENPSSGPGGVEMPEQTKQATNEISKEDIREYFKNKDEVWKKELADNLKELREKYEESEKAKHLVKAKDLLEKAEKADRESEALAARERQKKRIVESKKKELSDKAKNLFEEAEKAEWEEVAQEQEKQAAAKTEKFDKMTLEEKHKALIDNNDEAWAGLKKLLISGNPDDVEYAKKILTPTDKSQKSIKSGHKTTSAKKTKKVKKKKVRRTARKSHKKHPRKRSKRRKSRANTQRNFDTVMGILGVVGAISNTSYRKSYKRKKYRKRPRRKSYKRNRNKKRPNKGGGYTTTVSGSV